MTANNGEETFLASMFCFPNSHYVVDVLKEICIFISYVDICTWMHVYRTFEHNTVENENTKPKGLQIQLKKVSKSFLIPSL